MSTRAERKRRRNRARCSNCGEFGHHFNPFTKTYTCKPTARLPYPGERRR